MAAVTSNLSQFAPVYPPISIKAPSEVEKFASKVLKTYIDLAYPQESTESRQAREKVLAKVEKLIKTLVKNCTIETGVSEDQANEGGGNIFMQQLLNKFQLWNITRPKLSKQTSWVQ